MIPIPNFGLIQSFRTIPVDFNRHTVRILLTLCVGPNEAVTQIGRHRRHHESNYKEYSKASRHRKPPRVWFPQLVNNSLQTQAMWLGVASCGGLFRIRNSSMIFVGRIRPSECFLYRCRWWVIVSGGGVVCRGVRSALLLGTSPLFCRFIGTVLCGLFPSFQIVRDAGS